MSRYVGNAKVPPSERRRLCVLKAVKQGLYLRPARADWPALWTLSREDAAAVKAHVRDVFVWEATGALLTPERRTR